MRTEREPDMSGEALDGRRLNTAFGARRLYLAALDGAVVADPHGLVCGVVGGQQGLPVLKVVCEDRPSRSVDVGCEVVGDRWWFRLEDTGEGVTPVGEVERAPEVLAGILGRDGGR